MVKAASHKTISKKKTNSFTRFQAHRFARMNKSWRKPHGIDSPVRHRYRGAIKMVNIGYGSDAATRGLVPAGFYPVRVFNLKDLEALVMDNTTKAAVLASSLSTKTRAALISRAEELDIRVLNRDAKTRVEETN